MPDNPVLSVIIASYNARHTIRSCLRSLAVQTARSSMEVIVVDSSSDGTADIVAGEFPWVELLNFPQRKYCGDARNAGLTKARGHIIALMDADCTADETWAEEILKVHESSSAPAIGGAIANGNPESYVGWAAYFCEFSDWMPGSRAGTRKDIAGAGMSYKKEVFNRYGYFIPGTYGSDTEFHWRLIRGGFSLQFAPTIQVFHRNIPSLGRFLRHEFQHGRSFARVRVSAQHFTHSKRLVYSFLFAAIVSRLFVQIAARTFKNAGYRKYFIISFPLTLLGVIAWSSGEAFGYFGK